MAEKRQEQNDHIVRYGMSSKAIVAYIRDHESFSNYARERLILPALARDNAATNVPSIMSVCAYTPSFFYRRISGKASEGARNVLDKFQKTTAAELNLSAEHEAFQHEKTEFMKLTNREFPHFQAVRHEVARSVRVCMFCRDDSPEAARELAAAPQYADTNYLDTFRKVVPPAHAYAFFRWLNGTVPCRIVKPSCWSHWGMERGRDFAVLNGQDVVEYHEEWNAAVIVEKVDSNWDRFACIGSLVSRWSDVQDDTWEGPDFFDKAYGVFKVTDLVQIIEEACSKNIGEFDPDRAAFMGVLKPRLTKLKNTLPRVRISDTTPLFLNNELIRKLLHRELDITNFTDFKRTVEKVLCYFEGLETNEGGRGT